MRQKVSIRQRLRVASDLRKAGYSIVKHRYSCRYGQIDFVAECKDLIRFVKILPVDTPSVHSAEDYVTKSDMESLKRTSAFFMSANESTLPYRVDLAMSYSEGKNLVISYREDILRGESI